MGNELKYEAIRREIRRQRELERPRTMVISDGGGLPRTATTGDTRSDELEAEREAFAYRLNRFRRAG